MKKSILLIAVLMSVVSLGSRANDAGWKQLREFVLLMNSQCPIPVGSTVNITSMSLDSGDILMELAPNQQLTSGFKQATLNADDYRNVFTALLPTSFDLMPDTRVMYKMFVDAGAGMKIVIKSGNGSEPSVTRLSNAELSKALTDTPDYKKAAEIQARFTNMICPAKMGYATTTGVKIKDNSFVTEIIVDEKQVNIDVLSQNQAYSKQAILNVLKAGTELPTIALFFQCAKAGYDVVYNYVGDMSGKTVSIVITPAEALSNINLQGK